MNTKELLEKALESAKRNGETLMVLHHKNGNLNYLKAGSEDVMAGCMALLLGEGMGDDGDESARSFALSFCVAGAAVEHNGLYVCDTIKDMASELAEDGN